MKHLVFGKLYLLVAIAWARLTSTQEGQAGFGHGGLSYPTAFLILGRSTILEVHVESQPVSGSLPERLDGTLSINCVRRSLSMSH